MKSKRKRDKADDAVQLVLDWFSDYHMTIITEEEAREFIPRLPRAVRALQRIQEIIEKRAKKNG